MPATFPQRLWRIARSIAKWTIIAIVALRLSYCLAEWEEGWRGAHDWAAVKKELLAKGEILDLRQLAPPGNPQDDLSKVPIFADIYQLRVPDGKPYDRQSVRSDRIAIFLGVADYDRFPRSTSYLRGQPENLSDWQRFYRSVPQAHLSTAPASPAGDVLQALAQLQPELGEVESATGNPKAFWPLQYGNSVDFVKAVYPELTVYKCMQQAALVCSLQGAAHLANHQSDLAEKDFLSTYALSHSFEKNSDIIPYLIGGGIQTSGNSILWEGIHRHEWNTRQLQEMDSLLAATDGLALAAKSLRIGRARELQYIDFVQKKYKEAESARSCLSVLINPPRPEGWWDQDRSAFCLTVQRHIEAIDRNRGILNRVAQSDEPRSSIRNIYTPVTQHDGRLSGFDDKVAEIETYRRLARVACRLEEFYLLRNQYPEKLEELSDLPPHLNQEVLREMPFHYARKGNGYLLYSTGLDGKDHGGVPRSPPYVKDDVHNAGDEWDWIWPGP